MFTFLSQNWVAALHDSLITSGESARAARKWRYGAVSLELLPAPEAGFDDGAGIWFDLLPGRCRETRRITSAEARQAPFCITGDYPTWKAVVSGGLDPIKALLQGRLTLGGSLRTILRHVGLARQLVKAARRVATALPGDPVSHGG